MQRRETVAAAATAVTPHHYGSYLRVELGRRYRMQKQNAAAAVFHADHTDTQGANFGVSVCLCPEG